MLLLLLGVAWTGARPARALDPDNAYDRIALTALKYEGSYGGQCWEFMKDVVREATGREIGFDYREGYFEAGATEVTSIEAVRSGDIIQIVDDTWTSPDADYPGLHTSIVLTNLGGGAFDVIDSNQNFDGMVRLRANYKPFEAAARYGLQVHFYRILQADPVPGDAPGPQAATGVPFRSGDTGSVNTPGECLNLRTGGGLGNAIIRCLPHGTRVTAIGESVVVGGRYWAKVRTDAGEEGWVATEFLSQDAVPASGGAGAAPILPFRAVLGGLAVN
jgi:hypothetical protein